MESKVSKIIDLRKCGITSTQDGDTYVFGYGKTRTIRQLEFDKISKILATVEDMGVDAVSIHTNVKRPYVLLSVDNGSSSFSLKPGMIILYIFDYLSMKWRLVKFYPYAHGVAEPNYALSMDKSQTHVIVIDTITGKVRQRYPV